MKQRIITLLLAAGCVAFGIVGALVYMAEDHTAPKITIEKEDLSYEEGEDYDALMRGVSAKDNRDGDLSDEVFVDKIVSLENGKAMVYYGVMDQQNNVGTAQRKIDYVAAEAETSVASAEEQSEEQKNDGQASEDTQTEDNKDKKDDGENKDNEDDKNKDDKDDKKDELKPDGERPAMALTKEKMTIKAGEAFDVLSVVENAVDDKDDRSTLYQHIHVDGKYSTRTKGTYKISYYVTDSDGNASEKQKFTLTVK